MKKRNCKNSRLGLEHGSARAAIGTEKRLFHDFDNHICTSYASSIDAQGSSYHDRLNAALGNAQVCGKFLAVFRVRYGDGGHSLYHGYQVNVEERGGRTLPLDGSDRSDVFVAVPPIVRALVVHLVLHFIPRPLK